MDLLKILRMIAYHQPVGGRGLRHRDCTEGQILFLHISRPWRDVSLRTMKSFICEEFRFSLLILVHYYLNSYRLVWIFIVRESVWIVGLDKAESLKQSSPGHRPVSKGLAH